MILTELARDGVIHHLVHHPRLSSSRPSNMRATSVGSNRRQLRITNGGHIRDIDDGIGQTDDRRHRDDSQRATTMMMTMM